MEYVLSVIIVIIIFSIIVVELEVEIFKEVMEFIMKFEKKCFLKEEYKFFFEKLKVIMVVFVKVI